MDILIDDETIRQFLISRGDDPTDENVTVMREEYMRKLKEYYDNDGIDGSEEEGDESEGGHESEASEVDEKEELVECMQKEMLAPLQEKKLISEPTENKGANIIISKPVVADTDGYYANKYLNNEEDYEIVAEFTEKENESAKDITTEKIDSGILKDSIEKAEHYIVYDDELEANSNCNYNSNTKQEKDNNNGLYESNPSFEPNKENLSNVIRFSANSNENASSINSINYSSINNNKPDNYKAKSEGHVEENPEEDLYEYEIEELVVEEEENDGDDNLYDDKIDGRDGQHEQHDDENKDEYIEYEYEYEYVEDAEVADDHVCDTKKYVKHKYPVNRTSKSSGKHQTKNSNGDKYTIVSQQDKKRARLVNEQSRQKATNRRLSAPVTTNSSQFKRQTSASSYQHDKRGAYRKSLQSSKGPRDLNDSDSENDNCVIAGAAQVGSSMVYTLGNPMDYHRPMSATSVASTKYYQETTMVKSNEMKYKFGVVFDPSIEAKKRRGSDPVSNYSKYCDYWDSNGRRCTNKSAKSLSMRKQQNYINDNRQLPMDKESERKLREQQREQNFDLRLSLEGEKSKLTHRSNMKGIAEVVENSTFVRRHPDITKSIFNTTTSKSNNNITPVNYVKKNKIIRTPERPSSSHISAKPPIAQFESREHIQLEEDDDVF